MTDPLRVTEVRFIEDLSTSLVVPDTYDIRLRLNRPPTAAEAGLMSELGRESNLTAVSTSTDWITARGVNAKALVLMVQPIQDELADVSKRAAALEKKFDEDLAEIHRTVDSINWSF